MWDSRKSRAQKDSLSKPVRLVFANKTSPTNQYLKCQRLSNLYQDSNCQSWEQSVPNIESILGNQSQNGPMLSWNPTIIPVRPKSLHFNCIWCVSSLRCRQLRGEATRHSSRKRLVKYFVLSSWRRVARGLILSTDRTPRNSPPQKRCNWVWLNQLCHPILRPCSRKWLKR